MADILIIEDEAGLRESLAEGLAGAFPDSTLAAYGSVEEAVRDVEADPPRLVITDVRLPGRSGVDFLLDARQRWPAVRFILITAYATLVTHEQASEYGAFRLLQKPFALHKLVETVQDALGAAFSGNVEGISILDLLQLANLGKKSFKISVRQGAERGQIYFRKGEVIHAVTERLEGIAAFNEMVRWQRGEFETRSEARAPRTTVREPFQRLILEALRILDEENRRRTEQELGVAAAGAADRRRDLAMVQADLETLASIDGFLGACLVDGESGAVLGEHGGGPFDLTIAAAGNTEMVRAERGTLAALELRDQIEDILISLDTQYHLLRPMDSHRDLFLYLVLDRSLANLAIARHELKKLGSRMDPH
jgi:CheY-like chemotaxis protein